MEKEIKKLHKKGYSYNQIKDELGCSKGTISYHLGKGQKEKTIKRTFDRRNRNKKIIQEYKQDSICADCKENYPYWMLEFDHLENKKFNISSNDGYSCSEETLMKEIKKCDIVCANCHRNRTYLRKIKHGSDSMDVSNYY